MTKSNWYFKNPGFNTQPPEGGWCRISAGEQTIAVVSTHSRPKAAGTVFGFLFMRKTVSTHSRPKAAGLKFQVA